MIYKDKNPDGTKVYRDSTKDSIQVQSPSMFPTVPADHMVDDLTALQFGMAFILDSLTFKSVNRSALLLEGKTYSEPFQLQRVFLDWPDPEEALTPGAPTALIRQDGEAQYGVDGALSGQEVMEDTLDEWGEGTILRKYGEVKMTLLVEIITSNKDDRAAMRKTMIECFLAEPKDERPGRHVIVPQYWDRLARFELKTVSYMGDEPEGARQRLYTAIYTFDADIEVVGLVKTPTLLEPREHLKFFQ